MMKLQDPLLKGLKGVCKLFGVSRQAYYKKEKHQEKIKLHHEIVLQLVEGIRKIPQWKRMGTPKIYLKLKPEFVKMNIKMGRVALHALVMEYGLHVRCSRKRAITTDSYHRFRKYPNLVKGLIIQNPGLVWVADITYLSLPDRFIYLFLITDCYSHKIIGFDLSDTLAATGVLNALQMATRQYKRVKDNGVIHHSDRGLQYACTDYVMALKKLKAQISMAAKGNPYENPMAERVNGILKVEMGLERGFDSFDEARHEVLTTIEMYNNERLHSSINMLTPAVAHTMTGPIPKKWK